VKRFISIAINVLMVQKTTIVIGLLVFCLLVTPLSVHADIKIFGNNSAPPPSGLTNNVSAVAAGLFFYLALKNDHTVVEWEHANTENCHTAIANIQTLKNVIAISACGDQCLALTMDPATQTTKVFGFGLNFSGQLDNTKPLKPCFSGAIVNPVLSIVAAISSGLRFSLALTTDNRVIAWGDNSQGQCNVPAAIQGQVIAIAAGGDHSLALLFDQTVWEWGRGGSATPKHFFVGDPDHIVAIAAGNSLSVALRASGKISAWAEPSGCCMPTANGKTGYTAIAASGGGDYCLALKADGTVDGYDSYAQGEVPLPGCGSTPPCNTINKRTIPGWSHIGVIAAGDHHSLAIASDCSTPKASLLYSLNATKLSPPSCTASPLNIWLMADAGVVTTSGSSLHVSTWKDQSGNGNDFSQSDPVKQPSCDGFGIRFDGVNQWLTTGKPAIGLDPVTHLTLGHHTIIAYVRPTSPPAPNPAPAPSCSSPCIGLTWNTNVAGVSRFNAPSTIVGCQTFQMSSGFGITGSNADPIYACLNEVVAGSTFNGNPPPTRYLTLLQSSHHLMTNSAGGHMIAVTDDLNGNLTGDNHINLYVDADPPIQPAVPPPMHSSPAGRQISCIGGGVESADGPNLTSYSKAANLFSGDIYEILVYSEVLSDSQIKCIYQYLKCKWGN
jgi:hypothetical protein